MSIYHEIAVDQKPQKIDTQVVVNKAENRLMELIEREQLPGDVRSTLAGALSGDLTRQNLLFQAMFDTWPRLSKNASELADVVECANWQFLPHTMRGEKQASKDATSRVEFIEDAWNDTAPDIKRNEKSSSELIKQLCFGYWMGHHVVETLWEKKDIGITPRAYKNVPPRFYGYPYNEQGDDRLMFEPSGMIGLNYVDFPDHKFLIGINSAHPGHPTVAAPLRALTGYWLAANFGLKWLLQFCQLYGIPFRWANYANESDKTKVCEMLASIGAAGYGVFPKGTEINFKDASRAAESTPQAGLIRLADEQCDIFILGQTLTSTTGNTGSRALGEVHQDTKDAKERSLAKFVANILNTQLFPSIIEINYGDRKLIPQIKPVFDKKEDPLKLFQRDKGLMDMGIRFDKEWLYKRHDVPIPEEKNIFMPATPNGVQGEPATGPTKPFETKEKVAASSRVEAADKSKLTPIDKLISVALEELTGVTKEWLAPVRPIFEKLAALSMSKQVSDDDFIQALNKAQKEMPELFDKLNTGALQDAFGKGIGTALIEGSVSRYEGKEVK
jgi:phage gp29-like protein